MGLTADRVLSFIAYLPSAFLTSLGLLSLTDWVALTGAVLGLLTYRLNRRHKQRIEAEEVKRTAIFEAMAARATQHDLPEVACAMQEMAMQETRRTTS
ncbi:HP1 family phage holin [Pantoea ananatis]|uniref:HP1 family phage holin n=1 Tax=Pantoea ananas TaxID=553 RepID=UPI001B305260|nr:HP1 family phage holin [Pantoea ananatis]